MSTPGSPVKIGDVIHVGEPDYMYGAGDLRLRVTEIGTVQRLADGPWLNVRGIPLRADGSQLTHEPRQALVRMSALRNRSRPPETKS